MRELFTSDVGYIKKMPVEWSLEYGKSMFDEVRNINIDSSETNALKFTYGEIVRKDNFDANKEEYVAKTIKSYNKVCPNDIVINGLNLNYDFISQRVGIVTENGIITSAYLVLRPKKHIMPKYLNYLLKSCDNMKVFHGMGEGIRQTIKFKDIGKMMLPLPPFSEQQAIVIYLDAKCNVIDKVIAHKRSVIEKLKEYRTAIIKKAVTKGLNPDVEMKDSGNDWFGKIPKNWEVNKIKFNISLIGSGSTPKSSEKRYYEGNIHWIQSGDVYNTETIVSTEKTISFDAIEEISALKFYKNEFLVVAMYGASIGNVAISKIDACTNQACCVIKPDKNNDIKYLLYWLKYYKKIFELASEGGTQPNISQDKVKRAYFLRPSLSEQKQIVDYLDIKCSKIDTAIQQQEQIIEKLEEYRKSIIYYAVTGKIDCTKEIISNGI